MPIIKRTCKYCGTVWAEQSDSFGCECGETFFFPVSDPPKTEPDIPTVGYGKPVFVGIDLGKEPDKTVEVEISKHLDYEKFHFNWINT